MSNPYTAVSISGYNNNAPPDDGSVSANNKVTWAKHKEKLADPVKTAVESINTNVLAAFAATYLRTIQNPQGYLTLTSGTPAIQGDVSAATAVYYTPDQGNLVPVTEDGSIFEMREFSELTLTLSSSVHLANQIYDVFIFLDSGTITIGTGPAWSTPTAGSSARGGGAGSTAIERLKGRYVNSQSLTAKNGGSTYTVAANRGLYVGSLFMDGTNGQISCHRTFGQSRKWGVWNAYNRRPIILKVGDSTASWTYNSATIRASNGSSANKGSPFCGLGDEFIDVEFGQTITSNDATDKFRLGIGWNSTTAFSGLQARHNNGGTTDGSTPTARYINAPAVGLNDVQCLEAADNGTIDGIFGGNGAMQMLIRYNG